MASMTVKVDVCDEVLSDRRLAKKVVAKVLSSDEVINTIVMDLKHKASRKQQGKRKSNTKLKAIEDMLSKSERPLPVTTFTQTLGISRDYVAQVLKRLIREGLVDRFQTGPNRGFGRSWCYVWKNSDAQMEIATRPETERDAKAVSSEADENPVAEPYIIDGYVDITI